MKLRIDAPEKKTPTLELGDIIVCDGLGYLVIKEGKYYGEGQFIARGLTGATGLFGHHETLEALNHAFKNRVDIETIVYKKHAYELKLVEKGEY